MKKFLASVLLCFAACGAAGAADDVHVRETVLSEYRAIIAEIERERDALADERAWMEEERSRKEVDDRIYDELAVIIDRRMELLRFAEAKLEREIKLAEAERARMIELERLPRRAYSIKDPLIKRDLDIKIHRYWWLD